MALPKLFNLITWHNNTTPAINEDNLNAMSQAIDGIDDRVIGLAGTIMEDVPQIQEDIEELEEDFALIDEKIADATAEANRATSEANRATTKANEAAASVISAGDKALVSEGWAKGTQNGVPVGPTSPFHNNNAEYFKNLARSFTPEGYQDLVDDVAEAQEAITDIEGENVSDNEAYILRQGKGNMVDFSIVGGSVAWNQLIKHGNFDATTDWTATRSTASASSNELTVTATGENGFAYQSLSLIPNHKYLVSVDAKGSAASESNPIVQVYYGTWDTSWAVSARSTSYSNYASVISAVSGEINEFRLRSYNSSFTNKFKNAMCFDLTALFGTTIADYIYSLEQATAGAGVAWFRQYFPNAYYGYNAGSIISVNPSKRVVVGFNLWNELSEFGRYDTSTGEKITYSYTKRNANPITVLPNKEIYLYSNVAVRYFEYDSNGNYLGNNVIYSGGGAFTTRENTAYINIQFGLDCKYVCINISKTTGTPKNGDYVPYNGSEFPFDSSKQLRGVPQLVNNKLSYDGDIYKADGSVTRKYGIVDLGTLDYAYISANGYMASQNAISNAKAQGNAIVSDKFVYSNDISSVTIPSFTIYTGKFYCALSGYTDPAQFKTAMDGVYLVYELETPTTESATPFQNPQSAFSDGIEEFVYDSEIAVPVGNNSVYQTSEIAPLITEYAEGVSATKVDWESNAFLGAHQFNKDVTTATFVKSSARTKLFEIGVDKLTAGELWTVSFDISGVSGYSGTTALGVRLSSSNGITEDVAVPTSATHFEHTFKVLQDKTDYLGIYMYQPSTEANAATVTVSNVLMKVAGDNSNEVTPYAMTNQQLTNAFPLFGSLVKANKDTAYTSIDTLVDTECADFAGKKIGMFNNNATVTTPALNSSQQQIMCWVNSDLKYGWCLIFSFNKLVYGTRNNTSTFTFKSVDMTNL